MMKLLKVKFKDDNQTLDVPDNCEIVANLFASLDGSILLIRTKDAPAPVEAAPEAPPAPEAAPTAPEELGLG